MQVDYIREEYGPNRKVHVYLAGPMSGIPHFNYPAFHRAAAELRAEGYEVFNPAEADTERYGFDISLNNTTGTISQDMRRECLAVDLGWIARYADMIAVLPGWGRSTGVAAELALARALDLEVRYL